MQQVLKKPEELSKEAFIDQVLDDYRIAFESRQASLLGRKEVLTGKAKFGIFGDGKEVAQWPKFLKKAIGEVAITATKHLCLQRDCRTFKNSSPNFTLILL
jgi:hypothetical protein